MKRTIEVRPAEGGQDAKIFAKQLTQSYQKFADKKG